MRSDFELDSQLLAYDQLLLKELKPEYIAESLLLKPADQWMLELERDTAALAAAWQLVCGELKYNKRYLLSNLRRHLGIAASLQKTLTRYMSVEATDSCMQVYRSLSEGLDILRASLLIEQGQLAAGEELMQAVTKLTDEVYRFPLTLNGDQLALMAQLCMDTGILKPEEKEIKKCMSVIVDHVLTRGGKPLTAGSVNRQRKAAGAKTCEQVEALLEEALRILREVYMLKAA